jgi:hypothetical protein
MVVDRLLGSLAIYEYTKAVHRIPDPPDDTLVRFQNQKQNLFVMRWNPRVETASSAYRKDGAADLACT